MLKRKFDSNQNNKLNLKLLEYNKSFNIGFFSVQICSLTHSIPEPNAIILKTEKGNIFHMVTGRLTLTVTQLMKIKLNKYVMKVLLQ